MSIKELLLYEMPTIGEYISIKWIQDIIARYLAWNTQRKYDRYLRRKRLMRRAK